MKGIIEIFLEYPVLIDWVVIPLLIFVARLIDVSLATLRHILVSKGQRNVVPFLAFVEVSIWLLAFGQVMQNLSSMASFLAWASGFSLGTYLGMIIEEKLALGYQLVRVITNGDASAIIQNLSKERFGITTMKAIGSRGGVEVLLVVSERKRLSHLLEMLRSLNPQPFYTIEDVRSVGTSSIRAINSVPGEMAMEGSLKKK